MTEWQPIETAPKDGADCLLWEYDRVYLGGWYKGEWWVEGAQITASPTHWMPLPPPPLDAIRADMRDSRGSRDSKRIGDRPKPS